MENKRSNHKQMQVPLPVYLELRRIAAENGISMAQVLTRLAVYLPRLEAKLKRLQSES